MAAVAQPGAPAPAAAPPSPQALEDLAAHVLQLTHPDSSARESALLELSKKREEFPDLAPMLWHSVGTITALLQEIIAIYPALAPPTLTAQASNRVCNALALLQCVASHSETRALFLSGTCGGRRGARARSKPGRLCADEAAPPLAAADSRPPGAPHPCSAHPAVPVPVPRDGVAEQAV